MQGLSLLKKLVDMDEWSHIRAVARSELPVSSSKVTQMNLDLNDKDVRGLHYSFGQRICNFAGLCRAVLLVSCLKSALRRTMISCPLLKLGSLGFDTEYIAGPVEGVEGRGWPLGDACLPSGFPRQAPRTPTS